MTTMILSPSPVLQFFDDNGALLVGGVAVYAMTAGKTAAKVAARKNPIRKSRRVKPRRRSRS